MAPIKEESKKMFVTSSEQDVEFPPIQPTMTLSIIIVFIYHFYAIK